MIANRTFCSIVAAFAASLAVSAAVGATAAPAAAAPAGVTAVDALEPQVVAEVNAFRRRHGLAALRVSVALRAAADRHSAAMATRGFFAHNSAVGSVFWNRCKRSYVSRGYLRCSVVVKLLLASSI